MRRQVLGAWTRRMIPNRSAVALAVSAASLATAAALVPPPQPPPALDTSVSTLRFQAAPFTQTRLPQAAPDAPLRTGDRLFWVTQLSQAGRPVGAASHVCTASDQRWLDCTATMSLPRGEVDLQTALDTQSSTVAPIAVTGGTGPYRDAAGQLVIAFAADGSAQWSLQLVRAH
jgi:hypothetical protein